MKVVDLINELEDCRKEYGEEFLEWDVYTEQCDEIDKNIKKGSDWKTATDSEDFEYFECAGFWTKFTKKKIFTINVNY